MPAAGWLCVFAQAHIKEVVRNAGGRVSGDRHQTPPLPAARVQAAALRTAFPRYVVNVIQRQDEKPRYEVVRRDAGPGLYCLISDDAREIWDELRRAD
jgi:hypothetical protein